MLESKSIFNPDFVFEAFDDATGQRSQVIRKRVIEKDSEDDDERNDEVSAKEKKKKKEKTLKKSTKKSKIENDDTEETEKQIKESKDQIRLKNSSVKKKAAEQNDFFEMPANSDFDRQSELTQTFEDMKISKPLIKVIFYSHFR